MVAFASRPVPLEVLKMWRGPSGGRIGAKSSRGQDVLTHLHYFIGVPFFHHAA